MKIKKIVISILIPVFLCVLLLLGYKSTIPNIRSTQDSIKIIDTLTEQMVKENTRNEKNGSGYYVTPDSTYDFGSFTWDTEGSPSGWTYYNGLMMFALLKTGKYSDYVNTFYKDNITDDGYVNSEENFFNYYKEDEIDSVLPARTLFYLNNDSLSPSLSDNTKYIKAIKYVYNNLKNYPTNPKAGNNFVHKINSPKWTNYIFSLDGLYMAQPFLMECSSKYKMLGIEKEEADKIRSSVFRQMEWTAENMKDKFGLYNHGVDYHGKLNRVVWLRAVGWYAMAQVDVIELMPEGSEKEKMKERLVPFFDAMLRYRDKKTHLWFNVINIPGVKNNRTETSGSAMMAYALLKAYNNGYVTDTKYKEAGLETFNSLAKNKIRRYAFKYILKDTYSHSNVKSNYNDYCKKELYKNNEAKGLSALILAANEAEKT